MSLDRKTQEAIGREIKRYNAENKVDLFQLAGENYKELNFLSFQAAFEYFLKLEMGYLSGSIIKSKPSTSHFRRLATALSILGIPGDHSIIQTISKDNRFNYDGPRLAEIIEEESVGEQESPSPPEPYYKGFGLRLREHIADPEEEIDLSDIADETYILLGFKTPDEALDYMGLVNQGYLSGDTKKRIPQKPDLERLAIYLSWIGFSARHSLTKDLTKRFKHFEFYRGF